THPCFRWNWSGGSSYTLTEASSCGKSSRPLASLIEIAGVLPPILIHRRAAMAATRICFLGDSYVSGAFDPDCLGWAGRICAAARARGHDVSLYNLGIRGETSVQLAARWRGEASKRQSPLQEERLVFEFGMNDVREING